MRVREPRTVSTNIPRYQHNNKHSARFRPPSEVENSIETQLSGKLAVAAETSDTLELQRLLTLVENPRKDLNHALRVAAKRRNRTIVRLLLSNGAVPERAFTESTTPARKIKCERLAEFLETCGIDSRFIISMSTYRNARNRRRFKPGPEMRARLRDLWRMRQMRIRAPRREWESRADSLRIRKALRACPLLIVDVLLAAFHPDGAIRENLPRAAREVISMNHLGNHRQYLVNALIKKMEHKGYIAINAPDYGYTVTGKGLKLMAHTLDEQASDYIGIQA